MSTLSGHVVIVTGAGSGIGKETALLAAREGASVVVAEVDPEKGMAADNEILESGGQSIFIKTDVADEVCVAAMVAQTLEAFGRVDSLVNNAGIDLEGPTTSFSQENWKRVIDVNLGGTFLCSRACLPALRRQGGSIVNIASVHASFGFAGAAAYDASKGGMVSLTRSLAVENAPDQVRVNAICPGYIDTPLWENFLAQESDPERIDRITRVSHPLRRRGTPLDIAQAVRFLISNESTWITGSTLVVDGGMGAQFFQRAFD
ncbi:MAG: SDR family oxidoreductase [Fuerstiella sp.]|nr:SDR family oxidoreductase [Fuerstiella sp.]